MPKISINRLDGIQPCGKKVVFDVEDKEGNPTTLELYVYPFKTDEKIKLKQMGNALKKIDEKSEEYEKMSEDNAYLTMHMILKKSIDDITLDDIKVKIPIGWFEVLYRAALSFEGVTDKDFENAKEKGKKKLLDQ